MSTDVLVSVIATAPPETHPAIIEAVRQRHDVDGGPVHEVWRKTYSGSDGPDDLCLGSYRVVGLGDGIHDTHSIRTKRDLIRVVADQTRLRVLAAGATKCTVIVHDVEDTPSITLVTDGSEDR
jgi:hypothetical protein